ncbi:PEGA domain-containing protein [Pseudomonas sp. ABC1]|uniref:PEGA domain-containing protein n=1 Tax=Pseudomonas sp. ABC1 TaxID=2748080 RepID=UPI0015C329B8|nr:PEGA domain-containing protein [Pseudomonas sp. ABC1]QLF92529.1 PEGA domain-containing protein [Pseudomonas sp. ABC1]
METDVSYCSKPVRYLGISKPVFLTVSFFSALLVLSLVGGGESQAEDRKAAPSLLVTTGAGEEAPGDSSQGAPSSRAQALAAKIAELDAILLERKRMEDSLRVEKSAQSAAALQSSNVKKLVRLEVEDFFEQTSNRERLDSLLEDYKRSADEETAVRQRVQNVEQELGDQHLRFTQAARDVERLKAQLASEVRQRDSKRIQAIASRLDRTIHFNEAVTFRCSTAKSLAACLADYEYDGRMPQWVQEHYQRVLGEEIRDQVSSLKVSPNWFSYRTKSDFSQASMSLDGTVSAQVSIEAAVTAKKMMACAILDVSYELCDSKSHSLIVRSNKFNDQVTINDQVYGSTPVSLMLDGGVYEIKVTVGGLTKSRSLTLNGDQVVNFNF